MANAINQLYTSRSVHDPIRQRYQSIINNSRKKLYSERYGISESDFDAAARRAGSGYSTEKSKGTDQNTSEATGKSTENGASGADKTDREMTVEERLDYQQKQLDDIWNRMNSMNSSKNAYRNLFNGYGLGSGALGSIGKSYGLFGNGGSGYGALFSLLNGGFGYGGFNTLNWL